MLRNLKRHLTEKLKFGFRTSFLMTNVALAPLASTKGENYQVSTNETQNYLTEVKQNKLKQKMSRPTIQDDYIPLPALEEMPPIIQEPLLIADPPEAPSINLKKISPPREMPCFSYPKQRKSHFSKQTKDILTLGLSASILASFLSSPKSPPPISSQKQNVNKAFHIGLNNRQSTR